MGWKGKLLSCIVIRGQAIEGYSQGRSVGYFDVVDARIWMCVIGKGTRKASKEEMSCY